MVPFLCRKSVFQPYYKTGILTFNHGENNFVVNIIIDKLHFHGKKMTSSENDFFLKFIIVSTQSLGFKISSPNISSNIYIY